MQSRMRLDFRAWPCSDLSIKRGVFFYVASFHLILVGKTAADDPLPISLEARLLQVM